MAAKKKAIVKKKSTAKKTTVKKQVAKKTPAAKTSTAATKPAAKKTTTKKVKSTSEAGEFTPYTVVKNEEYMNEAQTVHFSKLLLDWKRDLMEEVDRTVHHMQDEASNFPDPNDRATQESEFAMELRARDRERKLIKKIDESLNNLENGEYGYCEQCGVEIGVQRLEARPTASLCIDCKSLDEIREKQHM